MEKVGLVLGKFAPFHHGHRFLIDFALERVNKLYILIYEDDGISGVPVWKRANWIRNNYSEKVKVITGYNSPTCIGLDEITKRVQEEYILSVLPEKVTHFFSSELYGEHVALALNAENVLVDFERCRFDCSGTKIRGNPYDHRFYLDFNVYRDLIKKIVFVGAESSGKTTLAKEMAKIYRAGYAVEMGRDYWLKYNHEGKLTAEQLVDLSNQHITNEELNFWHSRRLCFIDTNALTTAMFARHYGEPVLPKLVRRCVECKTRYDLHILCNIDIKFEQDGTRIGQETRIKFHEELKDELSKRGIRYHVVSGDLPERIRWMKSLLYSEFKIQEPF